MMRPTRRPILLVACTAIVFLLTAMPLTTPSAQQDTDPITKKALLNALGTKALSSQELVREISQSGVAFELTDESEKDIRRAGKYLGKNGLNALIAAVRDNYHPPAETPEVKADEPKPNIIPVGYAKAPIIYDLATRTFREGFAGQGLVTFVGEFRNAHESGKKLSEATDIRAHISFEPSEFYEKLGKGMSVSEAEKSTPGFSGADDGVWLDEAQPTVNFAKGETKTLILAAQSPDGTFAVYSHPIEQRQGIAVPFPKVRLLTADKYFVKVQITGGAHGEIAQLFHFTITLRPEPTISF